MDRGPPFSESLSLLFARGMGYRDRETECCLSIHTSLSLFSLREDTRNRLHRPHPPHTTCLLLLFFFCLFSPPLSRLLLSSSSLGITRHQPISLHSLPLSIAFHLFLMPHNIILSLFSSPHHFFRYIYTLDELHTHTH